MQARPFAHITTIRFVLMLLGVFTCIMGIAQPVNTPNKTGPMGLQVNTYTGNLFFSRTDLMVPARAFDFDISFNYNSFLADENIGFGNGWRFYYSISWQRNAAGLVTITWADGNTDVFTPAGGSTFKPPKGIYSTLAEYAPDRFELVDKSGIRYIFDDPAHQHITSMQDPNGNTMTFGYAGGLLQFIANNAGQLITLAYTNGLLSTVTEALASPTRIIRYTYDAAKNLTTVQDPAGTTNKYAYLVNGPLSMVTDKNDNKVNVVYFPDFTVREIVGCNKRIGLSYNAAAAITYATDFLQNGQKQVMKYTYSTANGQVLLAKMESNCCGMATKYEYDEAGNIISQTDGNGNTSKFSFDERGNLIAATNALNLTIRFTYTTQFNRVASYTDARGNQTLFAYDSRGNLIRTTEPLNVVTEMTYSPAGEMLSIKNPQGSTMQFTYDSYGNVLSQSGPLGFSQLYSYNARGHLLSITTPLGAVYQATYDVLDRLLRVVDPVGNFVERAYDAAGNLIQLTDENGHTERLFYDAANRLVKKIDPTGAISEMDFDAVDNLVSFKDALGNTTQLQYDNAGRLTAMVDAIGQMHTFAYDAAENVTEQRMPTGQVYRYEYDATYRLRKIEDAVGMIASYAYDANDNMIAFANGFGAAASLTYDALNRLTKFTDPYGQSGTATYDANGNILSVTNRMGRTSNATYDALNRLSGFTNFDGGNTQYIYNPAGLLTRVKDQNNNVSAFAYTQLGQLARITYPDGNFMEFAYDKAGNVISRRNPTGSTLSFTYDAADRIIQKTLSGGEIFNFAYNKVGKLISAQNGSGIVSLQYDNLYRLIEENQMGRTTQYQYDAAARQASVRYPDSTLVSKQFDARGLLTSIAVNGQAAAQFTYNQGGKASSATYANGLKSNFEYDFAGRLISISTGTVQNWQYTYDKEANVTAVSRRVAPMHDDQLIYDNAQRLTVFNRSVSGAPPSLSKTYTYDAVGNRTAETTNGAGRTYTVNQLNQQGGYSGPGGSATFTYDANGNLTYDGTFYKQYNAENRLVYDSAPGGFVIRYAYDAFGRRMEKVVNGRIWRYTYSGLMQLELRNPAADTLVNRYVYVGYLVPLRIDNRDNTFYCHSNYQNSVETVTNAAGQVVERYGYDPYGNTQLTNAAGNPLPASPSGNRFGYGGHEWERETGYYNLPYRQYAPATGSFTQRDPAGYTDGLGLYHYSHNNPATLQDPMGMRTDTELFFQAENQSGNGSVNSHAAGSHGGGSASHGHGALYKTFDFTKNTLSALGLAENWVFKGDLSKITLRQFLDHGFAQKWKLDKLKTFLDNKWVQRFSASLKGVFLFLKIQEAWEKWNKNCPVDNAINVTEIGISTYSFLSTLSKTGWLKFSIRQIPILKAYGIMDAISKLVTGNSVLKNTKNFSNFYGDMMDKHPTFDKVQTLNPVAALGKFAGYMDGYFNISNGLSNAASGVWNSLSTPPATLPAESAFPGHTPLYDMYY